jgi:hypothetical protein
MAGVAKANTSVATTNTLKAFLALMPVPPDKIISGIPGLGRADVRVSGPCANYKLFCAPNVNLFSGSIFSGWYESIDNLSPNNN